LGKGNWSAVRCRFVTLAFPVVCPKRRLLWGVLVGARAVAGPGPGGARARARWRGETLSTADSAPDSGA
jgi:hypothetical protein